MDKLIQKIELLSKYTKYHDEIIEIIDKSRLSKQKKKIIKDDLTNLLLTQSTLDTFDK